jgi:hypothetical protein
VDLKNPPDECESSFLELASFELVDDEPDDDDDDVVP